LVSDATDLLLEVLARLGIKVDVDLVRSGAILSTRMEKRGFLTTPTA